MGKPRGLTQDGHHDVVFEDLNGATGDKVEHGQHVSAVDESVSGGCVGGLEPHGQGPQAAFSGSSKGLAAVEQVLVEVKADICLQALWEALQHLNMKHGSKQRDCSQGPRGSGILSRVDGFMLNFVADPIEKISRELRYSCHLCSFLHLKTFQSCNSSRRETRRTNSKQRRRISFHLCL